MATTKINLFLTSIFLLILTLNFSAAQTSISQNHPELKWQKIETNHFIIIYHNGVEELAGKIAEISEQIFPIITSDLGVEPPRRTPIIVTDYLDESNGLSTPLGHYIFLWTRSMEKYTTGDENWLKSLIAHEFTHIVSFYASRGVFGFWHELTSLGFIPTWFLEGVAQLEAEKWCAHRDMLLRVVTFSRKMLPFKRMTGFIAADQVDARLVYEQGHSLVRYIFNNFGEEKVRLIFQKIRSFPFSFNLALKRTLGISEKELYRRWRRDVQKHYDRQFHSQVRINDLGEKIDVPFQVVLNVKFSHHGKYLAFVAMKHFDSPVRELYVKNLATGKIKKIATPYINSLFDWSPDGKKIVFAKKHVIPDGSRVFDLFLVDVETQKITQLTDGERANDPAFSPDASSIVYTKHEQGCSNLWMLNLISGTKTRLTNFGLEYEVFSPDWSPDGNSIAYSLLTADGKRDIYVLNLTTKNTKPLVATRYDDRYPSWSPDSTNLAFICYQNGAPNLFIKNLLTNSIQQLTSSPGGVFLPDWISESEISVISFEKRSEIEAYNLDLAKIKPIKSEFIETLPFHKFPLPVYQRKNFLSDSNTPVIQRFSKYNSFRQIKPQILLPYFDQNEESWQPGAILQLADPLEKHLIQVAGTYGKRPHFYLDYVNRQLAPSIQISLQKQTIDHGDFLYFSDGSSIPLVEDYRLASIGLNWLINTGNSLLSWHRFSIFSTFTNRAIINRKDYQSREIDEKYIPFQGWINYAGINYSFIKYRPDVFYDVHPGSGWSISSIFRLAHGFLHSDIQFYQFSSLAIFRQELPFARHVLALRGGLFFKEGEAPIQNRPALNADYLRGTEFSRSGNRQIFANFEYRFPIFRDLGLKLWIFYFEHIAGAVFTDIGKAWHGGKADFYGKKVSFQNSTWVQTVGIAIRHRLYVLGKIPLVLKTFYGVNLQNKNEKRLFFTFGSTF